MKHIQYDRYSWHAYGDLKVITLLLNLQLGDMKFCCSLCELDSQAQEKTLLKETMTRIKTTGTNKPKQGNKLNKTKT
jgi:hypothetical protein